MPQARPSYYAVKVGRGGPAIYLSWSDAAAAVNGFPGCRHRKFAIRQEAEDWLATPEINAVPASPFSANFQRQPSRHPLSRYEGSATERASSCDSLTPPPPYSPRNDSNREEPINQTPATRDLEVHEGSPPDLDMQVLTPLDDDPNSNGVQALLAAAEVVVGDPSTPPTPEVALSEEQTIVLEKVKEGRSLFFTGSAGTGKSVLMRAIIAALRGIHMTQAVAVTAPTGIAAVNVGGTTLHSFAGIGLGKENVDKLVGKILGKKDVKKRWRQTKVLVIDEISMVDAVLFDKLEAIARLVRDNPKNFGGLQLVISGDFFQLPPVPDMHDGVRQPTHYAFQARTWNACVGEHFTLTHVFRQKEQSFIDILNEMRLGHMSAAAVHQFVQLSRNVVYDDGLEPTQLYPTKGQVEWANNSRLQKLSGATRRYQAMDSGGEDIRGNKVPPHEAVKILDRLVALREVNLRIGAQVMLIKNLVQGRLVNGSMGKVIKFQTPKEASESRTSVAEAQRPQNERNTRVLTPPLPMVPPNEGSSSGPPSEKEDENAVRWPVVQFTNGETLLIPPMEFTVENMFGKVEAKRMQIPLICAWALSIHKSQGQTLERVKIDMAQIFEKGQAYVALSRATSLKTLQVLNFRIDKVRADPRVLEWSFRMKEHDAGDQSDDYDEYEDAFEDLDESLVELLSTEPSDVPIDEGMVEVKEEEWPETEDFSEVDEEIAMEAYYSGVPSGRRT